MCAADVDASAAVVFHIAPDGAIVAAVATEVAVFVFVVAAATTVVVASAASASARATTTAAVAAAAAIVVVAVLVVAADVTGVIVAALVEDDAGIIPITFLEILKFFLFKIIFFVPPSGRWRCDPAA